MTKLRVAVVFGGKSSEHSISCATAAGVLGAIDRNKYEVVPIGITKAGKWTLAADDTEKWKLRKGELAVVEDEGGRGGHPGREGAAREPAASGLAADRDRDPAEPGWCGHGDGVAAGAALITYQLIKD